MFDLVAEKLERINYSLKPSYIKKEDGFRNPIINSVVDFIYLFVDLNPEITKIVETTSYLDILEIQKEKIRNIVNIRWLNDVRNLNEFLNIS